MGIDYRTDPPITSVDIPDGTGLDRLLALSDDEFHALTDLVDDLDEEGTISLSEPGGPIA